MVFFELVSLSLFLGVIAWVYLKEMFLFTQLVFAKLRHKKDKQQFFRRHLVLHFLALIGVICFLYAYFIEPYRIEVKSLEIFTGKFKKISLRVVQISDLHCDRKIRNEYKLIKIVNELNPDIIIFTGDALNTPEALGLFKETMGKLKANIGKYAVLGNIDYYWRNLELYKGSGFVVLGSAVIELVKQGEKFFISGLSYHAINNLKLLLKRVPVRNYNIFLYHTPDLIRDAKNMGVDLYLCGHIHGGQVALPFYGAIVTLSRQGKKYERGEYLVGKTILYVNRGIGMEGGIFPRVRFFSRPEITVFDIKPKPF